MITTGFKNFIWQRFIEIDSVLKFPFLKEGEIGIQVGFDMINPFTSDIFLMHRRVCPSGQVIAIDPDPYNIEEARKIVEQKGLNICFVQCAVYADSGTTRLLMGEKPSWNRLYNLPKATVPISDRVLDVEMKTLDEIVKHESIDLDKIGHISLTINGSEYYALLGMKEILTHAKNMAITVVTGHQTATGNINGRRDVDLISALLKDYGFQIKFKRIHQLFWWGFIVKTLLNRKWIYGRKNYGILMAVKGNKKIPWYQSFS